MSYTPPTNPASWHTPTAGKLGQQDEQQPSPPGSHNELHKNMLTQEEIRVLKECNVESFYYRCVPLATLFSGLSYIAMKNGYLAKSPSYGYGPKMLLGAVVGYLGGKFSYQSACAEKIMRLPNSRLGDVLRKRKGLANYQENAEPGFSNAPPSAEFQHDNPIYDERRPDLSEHAEGSDSYNKVQESLSPYSDDDQLESNKFTSYEDLRRENRDEYAASKLSEKYKRENGIYRSPSPPPSFSEPAYSDPRFPSSRSPSEQSTMSGPTKQGPSSNHKKNKYGDLWDD